MKRAVKIGGVVTGILGSLLKQANPESCGAFLVDSSMCAIK